ncbi:class I SAM-dependent methyltransferase [Paeniglutamicibacter kerguelensis]|uniref:Ubiquinone/menaquinone biosynthesis C-methylase UbiE n=1 Tax=Paeniglutamicibacter kerguelensis TaxID=254788 RepID=A0ABS4XI79_9MICC|nr:methyltransferase domain-containing protein [Paeniglutamicibacter kerguelensis]MBP2388177.1 ubiquinone/menaquinone biosynthesis C-methylase UbiE [Paeniglutamicibacter kerguelensis]
MKTNHEAPGSANHAEIAPPAAWDEIAAGYARFVAPGEQLFSSEALRLVGLTRGEAFLDVAAGPGGLALAAARLGASVLATDWAPAMVSQFQARIRAEKLHNAEARVMDAHALTVADDSYDVTGSQFGVMLVPDQPLALREMVRVTKPGGRVLIVAYGSPTEFEALQFFISALRTVVPAFEGLPEPPPLEFQVSDPGVLRDRLTTAGLGAVEVDTSFRERVEFDSGSACWKWMCHSNPVVGMILSEVSEGEQAVVRDVLDGMIRERAADGPFAVLTAPLNIGWGHKPVPR